MKDKKLLGNILLLVTALIWGSSFVAQRLGTSYLEPFSFNSVRTIIGGLSLIPVIWFLDRKKTASERNTSPEERKFLLMGGIFCGVALFIASSLQQIGIEYTTAGKSGFITALYILLVPVFSIFLGKPIRTHVWGAIILGLGGLYLLCIKEGFSIGKGDFITLICAVAFAFHILIIAHYAPKVDGVRLSCIQFLVAGFLGLICMFIFEKPEIGNFTSCILPILYSGLFSCGIAYTLQIVGQKWTEPAVASLLMSFESVFAVVSGWLILGEGFSVRELGGCALMFCAVIMAQRFDHVDQSGDLLN